MDILKNEQKQKKRLKPMQAAVLKFMASIHRPTAKKVAINYDISLRQAKRHLAFLQTNGYLARRGNNRSGEYIILETEDLIHGE